MTRAGREAASAAAPSWAGYPQPVDRPVERVGTGRRVAVRSRGTGRGRADIAARYFPLPPAGMCWGGVRPPAVGAGHVTGEGGGHVHRPCDVHPSGCLHTGASRPRWLTVPPCPDGPPTLPRAPSRRDPVRAGAGPTVRGPPQDRVGAPGGPRTVPTSWRCVAAHAGAGR